VITTLDKLGKLGFDAIAVSSITITGSAVMAAKALARW
jgi:hypothetical protein